MNKNWKYNNLGELCQTGSGGTPLKSVKEYYNGGDIPWPLSGEVNVKNIITSTNYITEKGLQNSSAKVFPPDTVLIAMYGATAGQVGILRFKSATNQAICGILPNSKFTPEFLYYYFNWYKDKLVSQAVGNAQPNISQIKIRKTPVPLIALPEQQRIVSILDRAFESIDRARAIAEQNLKNARELFESYLQGVFEGKSGEWEERKLEEIVDKNCTLSYGIVQPGGDYPNGLAIVRPTDLTQKYITKENLKRINPELAEGYKRTKLGGSELLLCVRGTTGVISIATKELEGANVTRGIVPVRFDSNIVSQNFGYFCLISKFVQDQIKAKTYGAALMQINIGDLRKILVRYPKSIDIQEITVKKLEEILSKTETSINLYKKKKDNLEELKKSILQKAFAGEL